jgi:hypothetical protein
VAVEFSCPQSGASKLPFRVWGSRVVASRT